MKYLIYLLLIIVLCGVSVGLSPLINIRGQVPQLLFLLAFIWSLDRAGWDFLFVAFISGLFLDFYTGSFVGTFSMPLITVCLVFHFIIENFLALELSPKFLAALLLPAQILFGTVYFFYSWLLYKMHLWPILPDAKILAEGFIISFFYNLLFLYPIFSLTDYVRMLVRRYFEREFKVR